MTSTTIWAYRGAYADCIGLGGISANGRDGFQFGTGCCKSSTVYCCLCNSCNSEKTVHYDENEVEP